MVGDRVARKKQARLSLPIARDWSEVARNNGWELPEISAPATGGWLIKATGRGFVLSGANPSPGREPAHADVVSSWCTENKVAAMAL